MLQVQVAYWANQEVGRHNLEQEKLGWKTLDETVRHDQAVEAETNRHNQAQEQYWSNSLSESMRHNVAQEELTRYSNESGRFTSLAQMQNADTNRFDAQTRRFSAVTGYSLGLDANRIAQENADANAERNAILQQQANLEFLNYGNSSSNAYSNAVNAAASAEKVEQGWESLKIQKQDTESQITRRNVQNVTDFMNAWSHGWEAVGRTYTNVFNLVH